MDDSQLDLLERADAKVDTWLVRVTKSKWSPLWVLGFWLTGYAAGHFHVAIWLAVVELFWWAG